MITITKHDLQALRQATSVVSHYSTDPRLTNGAANRTYIRAFKTKARPGGVWNGDGSYGSSGDELSRDIDLAGSSFVLYDYDVCGREDTVVSAVDSVMSARFHETWATTASLLRVGDELHLKWIGGNNTENLNKAGLSHDELQLVVRRGKRLLTFAIVDRTSPVHSVARVIDRNKALAEQRAADFSYSEAEQYATDVLRNREAEREAERFLKDHVVVMNVPMPVKGGD